MSGTMSTEERQADLASSKETVRAMDDAELYASASADEPQAEAASEGTAQAEPEHKADATGRLHGQDGKFVSKAPQADAAPTQQQPTEQQKAEPTQEQPDAQVPSWRARELREQREAAERRAQDLERTNLALEQQLRSFDARLRQLTEKPKEPPDLYANPEAFVDDRLNPMRQQFGAEMGAMKENFSKMIAIQQHGKDAVTAAFAEMEKQMHSGAGVYDYARIMRSAHPYGDLVEWHKQHLTRQTVGDDPNAWFDKQLEARLADQAFQGKLLERIRGTASGSPPVNGSAPKVQLPPSLSRAPSAAGRTDDEGDLSDASLFRHAMR